MDPDTTDILTAEKDRTAAADRATAFNALPFQWRGKDLAPFAISRESFFHQHRAALQCPPHHELMGNFYSFQADTARLLWLLSHEPKEWLRFIAQQPRYELAPSVSDSQHSTQNSQLAEPRYIKVNPHVALEELISTWYEAQMATATAEEHREWYEMVCEIWDRRRKTQALPKQAAEDTEAADPGNAPGLR